jgi:hypothetical protein
MGRDGDDWAIVAAVTQAACRLHSVNAWHLQVHHDSVDAGIVHMGSLESPDGGFAVTFKNDVGASAGEHKGHQPLVVRTIFDK